MNSKISISDVSANKILDQLKEIQTKTNKQTIGTNNLSTEKTQDKSFYDHLKAGFDTVNDKHKLADKMAADLTSGKSENIHETMLAATQAELSFNLMVQLRNKAIEAYTEIMRMPV